MQLCGIQSILNQVSDNCVEMNYRRPIAVLCSLDFGWDYINLNYNIFLHCVAFVKGISDFICISDEDLSMCAALVKRIMR